MCPLERSENPSGPKPILKSRLPGTAKPQRAMPASPVPGGRPSGGALASTPKSQTVTGAEGNAAAATPVGSAAGNARGFGAATTPAATPSTTAGGTGTGVASDGTPLAPVPTPGAGSAWPDPKTRLSPASSTLGGKEGKIERLISAANLDRHGLSALCWSGAPQQYRPTMWRLLLGYMPSNLDRRDAAVERLRREYHDVAPVYFSAERWGIAAMHREVSGCVVHVSLLVLLSLIGSDRKPNSYHIHALCLRCLHAGATTKRSNGDRSSWISLEHRRHWTWFACPACRTRCIAFCILGP